MPPYKSTYSLSSTESPTSLTVPISPFSASSASDSIYTSDEQPDLGAFTMVLRELVHLQPPPRIPTVAHNHHLRRRHDFSDSRSEETTITNSTTLTSTGTSRDTDIERRSTVWNQQPIADYLRVSSITSDGAESDVEEGVEESDTEGARTVEIESATEIDDEEEEDAEDDIDEDAEDDEGNLGSEVDPSIQSQPAPSYLSVSSMSTEPDHDHEPEDVSPDYPSLGYLDKTLNFIAAERARWNAQRGSMLLDGSHTPRRPETWSHVIEPRRKRKRRRSDRPKSLARTARLLSRAKEVVELEAEKRHIFSGDNYSDQDATSEPSSHSIIKPKSKSKSVPASPFTHDFAFDHEPTDKTTVLSDVPSSTPRTRAGTRKKHKLRAASQQDNHSVMQILTRPEPFAPPSPPPGPVVLHLETQGIVSGPETGGDAASTSGPEAPRTGSHTRRRRRPKTRQALDANNLAGHSLHNFLSEPNKNAQTTNASIINDSPTKLPHSSTSHATREGHRLFNLAWQLGKLFPKDKLALDDILRRMKEVDNSGYNSGLDEGERNNLLDPRGPSPKDGDSLVHIFIDHSNILIGLLNYHKRHATPKRARNRPASLSIDATSEYRDSAMPPASLPSSTSAASPDPTAGEAIGAGMAATKNGTLSEGEGGADEYDIDNVVLERPAYLKNRVLHQGRRVHRTAEGKDENDNSAQGSNLVQPNMKAQGQLELSPIIIENAVEGVNVDGRIGSRRKAATSPSIYAESSSPSHATIVISRASSPSSSMLTSKARTKTRKSPESTPDRISPSSLTSAVTLPSALSIPHTPIPLPSFATAARVVYSAGTGLDTPVSSDVTTNATDNTRGSTPSTTPTHVAVPFSLPRKRAEAASTKPHFSQGYPSPASSGVQTATLSDSATRSNLTGDSSIPTSPKANDTISTSDSDVVPARSVEEFAEEGDVMLFTSPQRRKGALRRLSHTALTLILERGRPITRRVLVTSSPLYQPMDTMERLGYEVRVYIRVPDLGDGMDRERHHRVSEEKRKKRHSTSAIGTSATQSIVTSSSQPEGSREHRRRLSESISADSAGVTNGDAKSGTSSSALGLFLDDAGHSSVPTSLPDVNAEQPSSVGVSHSVDHGSSATTTTSFDQFSHPHSHPKHHLHQHVQHQHPHAAAALLAYTQSKWHALPAHTITGQRIRYREQGVDELLQLKLHQAIAAVDDVPKGATIVLATGDGNVGQFSEDGFLGPVRTALKRGWNVELYAWEEGLSRAWRKEFGEDSEWGRSGKFRIIALEQFAVSLLEETELVH